MADPKYPNEKETFAAKLFLLKFYYFSELNLVVSIQVSLVESIFESLIVDVWVQDSQTIKCLFMAQLLVLPVGILFACNNAWIN